MITPKKKFFLFKQSEHFCSVPWNHFKVKMDGTVTTCTPGRKILGDLKTQTIEEILSTGELDNIKRNLFNDSPESNCLSCRRLTVQDETQDYKFVKDLYNPMFMSNSVDYEDPKAFVLGGIDLHWGSTCNLKCITCWDQQSSAIAQELGSPILNTPTDVADKLIDFIASSQENIKEIYLSGGEPTLIKHNLRLLKRLRKDLGFVIRINSNMMFDADNQIIKELKEFPNVLFTISADAMGERFNYIRRGADWDVFLNNLETLQQYDNFKWRLNSVFFVASALGLPETQEFFMNNYDIHDFTINQVSMGRTEIQCRNLPEATKQQVRDKIEAHRDKYSNDLNLRGQLTNCLSELTKETTEDYHGFFDESDSRSGADWRKIFTELI